MKHLFFEEMGGRIPNPLCPSNSDIVYFGFVRTTRSRLYTFYGNGYVDTYPCVNRAKLLVFYKQKSGYPR